MVSDTKEVLSDDETTMQNVRDTVQIAQEWCRTMEVGCRTVKAWRWKLKQRSRMVSAPSCALSLRMP